MERDGTIPIQECWRLLSTTSFGKIAVSLRALPALVPVQYYLEEGAVSICMGHHRLPDSSVNKTVVAFAADGFDRQRSSGWTVQVLGVVSRADEPCDQPTKGQVLHLLPAQIEGYQVRMCPLLNVELLPG